MWGQNPAPFFYFADILDSLDIALCLFDSQDCTILWNRSFLRFFPEHDGHVHSGEPYRANLERFYRARLGPDELPRMEHYIADGIARHRAQTRPFTFSHRGRLLRVASLPAPGAGRLRIWQELLEEPGSTEAPPRETFPIDMVEHMADGAMVLDRDDRIVAVNQEFRRLYDVPEQRSVIGSTLAQVVRQAWETADPAGAYEAESAVLDNMRFAGAPFEIELPGQRWRRVIARRGESGVGYFTHADITELKRQQAELLAAERRARQEEDRYRLLAETSSDVILSVGHDDRIGFASPAALRVLGWSPDELLGRRLTDLVHEDERGLFDGARLQQGGAGGNAATFTCRVQSRDQGWRWMEASLGLPPPAAAGEQARSVAFVCSLRDAGERVAAEQALRLAHDELSSMASTDALTGLANRRRFETVFQQEWSRGSRDGWPLSLLMIDVDRFKAVNDAFGHVVGDECLRRIAAVISAGARRPADLVARYGGEEFAVLLPATPAAGAVALAEALRRRMAEQPWREILPSGGPVTLSIGVCTVSTPRGRDRDEMVRRADEALYQAKNTGRDRVVSRDLG